MVGSLILFVTDVGKQVLAVLKFPYPASTPKIIVPFILYSLKFVIKFVLSFFLMIAIHNIV